MAYLPDAAFIKTTHQTLSIGEASTNGQKKIVKKPDVKDRGDTFAVTAKEADQFFSQHPIIYRPTHRKNRTPTGGGQQQADGYLEFLAALTNS